MKQNKASTFDPKLNVLQESLCLKIDNLLCSLDVNLRVSGDIIEGPCPIHGGDNQGAFRLYPNNPNVPGYWQCYSRQCEKHFGKTILGFIRGVLSKKQGWSGPGDDIISFSKVVDWASRFLKIDFKSIKINSSNLEKKRFVSTISSIVTPAKINSKLKRQDVRSKLKIPADYFIKRGWSKEILDRFDVGLCEDETKPFFERVVVPVYDESYTGAVGFVARSIHDKCIKCNTWHNKQKPCPEGYKIPWHSKWRNSPHFQRDSHLYNSWNALKEIKRKGVAILVEGPGDLWRLEESDIKCGLAMFGTSLTDQQQIILEKSGAMKIVVVTNMDEPGRLAAQKIDEQLNRIFKIIIPKFDKNDLGEMKCDEVKSLLGRYL